MKTSSIILCCVAALVLIVAIASQANANRMAAKVAIAGLLAKYITAKKIYVAPIPLPIPIPIINEKNTVAAQRPKVPAVIQPVKPKVIQIQKAPSYGGGSSYGGGDGY